MDKGNHCGNGSGNGHKTMVLLMVADVIRHTSIVVALAILGWGCQQKPKEASTSRNATGLQTLEETEAEMNEAIETPRAPLSQFEHAILCNNLQYDLFILKVMSPDQIGGSEHIWITDLT